MTELRFKLADDYRIWENESKDIVVYETVNNEWVLNIKDSPQIFDSVYGVIGELSSLGYHPSFQLPLFMENIPSKCC